jgi:hypothetical protein
MFCAAQPMMQRSRTVWKLAREEALDRSMNGYVVFTCRKSQSFVFQDFRSV